MNDIEVSKEMLLEQIDRVMKKFSKYDVFDSEDEETRDMYEVYCIVKKINDTYEFNEKTQELELKIVGWRPQTRIDECEGCKAICEECELLVITTKDIQDGYRGQIINKDLLK